MTLNKFILAVSLSAVSLAGFADGFGVGADGNSANASASVNQLLGQAQTVQAPAGSGSTGKLSMTQVRAILKAQQQQNGQPAASNQAAPAANNADQDLGNTSMDRQAFAGVARRYFALSPDQIRTLRVLLDRSQQAAAAYPGIPPRPTSSSVMVNLSPGSVPPIVRMGKGFVSSLVFLDSTGQPWPIASYDNGDPDSFGVNWNKKNNTLFVQSNSAYKSGNLAVMLKGQDTPVMVTLMPGQRAVDYRVDFRVPGLGPNASASFSSLPDTANPQLLNFLNGVPPQGAKEVKIDGGPCEGWMSGGHVFLRTNLTVLSPSFMASMSSPDGTHVYEIEKAPVVLASYRGQVVQLTIEGL